MMIPVSNRPHGVVPPHNGGVRFGTLPAKTFPYEKYADLMTEVSVGGVQPGDLAAVSLVHQDVSPRVLDAYKQLMQRGYRVSFHPVPKTSLQTVAARPDVAGVVNCIEESFERGYDHVVTLQEPKWVRFVPGRLKDAAMKWFAPNPDLQALTGRDAQPGESVMLRVVTGDPDPLAEAVLKRIVNKRGFPIVLGRNRHIADLQRDYAIRDDQLTFVPPEKKWVYENMTKLFTIDNDGDEPPVTGDKPVLSEVERGRRKKLQTESNGSLSRIYMDRMGRIELGPRKPHQFFRTLAISPNPQIAKEFGMSLDGFGAFYKQITHLDKPDTVDYFTRMNALVGHYAKQLQKFHTFHVTRQDGKTDLTFTIRDPGQKESRYVAPSTITGNALPAEVFTSPVENSVNGKIYLDIPFMLDEKAFEGLTLRFKDGQVVDLAIDKGDEDHLKGMILGTGPKAHLKVANFDRLGEFAVGFNRQITRLLDGQVVKNTLIAEKQDLHFALGNSYPITGGKNQCALHVDIPARSGPGSGLKIAGWTDGSDQPMPVYEDGNFTDAFLGHTSNFDWKAYGDITWD